MSVAPDEGSSAPMGGLPAPAQRDHRPGMADVPTHHSGRAIDGRADQVRALPIGAPHCAPLRAFGVVDGGLAVRAAPFAQGALAPESHLLVHTRAGRGFALIGQARATLERGQMWLIPAATPYRLQAGREPWSLMWFALADARRWRGLRSLEPGPIEAGYAERCAVFIETLIAEHQSRVGGAMRMAQLMAEAIAIYLTRRLDGAGGGVADDAERLEVLWSRVAGALAEPWDVERLARACALPASRLRRLSTRVHGRGPMAQLTRLRLERARTLVGLSHLKLAEIAELVGYASPFALSKAYKRLFGHAPRSD